MMSHLSDTPGMSNGGSSKRESSGPDLKLALASINVNFCKVSLLSFSQTRAYIHVCETIEVTSW